MLEYAVGDGILPVVPPLLLVSTHILHAKELLMGVDEEWLKEWRQDNSVPDSDVIDKY